MSHRVLTCIVCLSLIWGGCADSEVSISTGADAGLDLWSTSEGDMALEDLEEADYAGEDLGLTPEEPLDMDYDLAQDMADEPPVLPPEPPAEPPKEPPEEPDPQEPNTPTVKTVEFSTFHWNIAGGKENACRPDLIRRAVLRFVRESPTPIDFISLNEVCASQYDAIEEALRGYWKKGANVKFSAFQPSNGSRVGNAFFSRVNVTDITRLELGTDQYGKRFLLCGLQNNRRLRVCTTHLTPGDPQARTQLGRVLNKIEDWWTNRRDTVVIGGDFNLHPNDAAFNAMYASGANTPHNGNNRGDYREMDDDDAQHCKGYGERTTPNTTGGPCGSGGKIDFTFVRANRIVNGSYRADALNVPTDCTGVCSDHRPLRSVVKIRYRID
jgi:endonuclease/exonuclease/phosphatase family metal-dependent hydrolase